MRATTKITMALVLGACAVGGCVNPAGSPEIQADAGAPSADGGDLGHEPLAPAGRGCPGGGHPADAGGPPIDGGTMTGNGGDAAASGADADSASSAGGGLRLTELDYDQPGPDDAELVELLNTGPSTLSLDGWAVVLINGTDGAQYGRIALAGEVPPGGFAVVATEAVPVAEGALRFEASAGFLQNGPDAVAVLDATGAVRDAVAYEGPVTWARGADAGAAPTPLPLAGAEDPGEGAIVRGPGGPDAGTGGTWRWVASPSPGAPNPD